MITAAGAWVVRSFIILIESSAPVMVNFETSANWPYELETRIRRTKCYYDGPWVDHRYGRIRQHWHCSRNCWTSGSDCTQQSTEPGHCSNKSVDYGFTAKTLTLAA